MPGSFCVASGVFGTLSCAWTCCSVKRGEHRQKETLRHMRFEVFTDPLSGGKPESVTLGGGERNIKLEVDHVYTCAG